jgi:hypothetical protein
MIKINARRMRTEEILRQNEENTKRFIQGYALPSGDDKISGELTAGPSRHPGFVHGSQGPQTIPPTGPDPEPVREDDFEEFTMPGSRNAKNKKKKQNGNLPASNTPTIISQVIYDMNVELGRTSDRIPNTVDIIVVYMYNSKNPTSGASALAHGAKQWDEAGRVSGADHKNNGSRLSTENLQPIPKEPADSTDAKFFKRKNPSIKFQFNKGAPVATSNKSEIFFRQRHVSLRQSAGSHCQPRLRSRDLGSSN